MIDIKAKIRAMVIADTGLIALMGITATDPRIYFYFNADAAIDTVKKAYITYALVGRGRDAGAIANPTFSFAIWAKWEKDTEAVADRLKVLFDKETIITASPSLRKLRGVLVHEVDAFQEQTKFAGKQLHFQFSWLSIG